MTTETLISISITTTPAALINDTIKNVAGDWDFARVPGTAYTASSVYSGGFEADKAFNDGAQYWLGTGGGVDWLKVACPSSHTVVSYGVRVQPTLDAARAPHDFKLQGSNDGSAWTDLDAQTDQTAWTAGELRTFAVVGASAYTYFRLSISANNGDATYTQVGELYLYDSVAESYVRETYIDNLIGRWIVVKGVSEKAQSGGGQHGGAFVG